MKRTALWNKAAEQLKKHQEFASKVKSTLPDFLKEPFGDPFVTEEWKDYTAGLEDSDNENDDNADVADDEELEQIKSALEEEDGSSKIFSQTMQTSTPAAPTLQSESPPKKKRPGRPKKHKKDSEHNGIEENMVSSSSQEPDVASIAVQTPLRLLKDLISVSSKISKEELRAHKDKVRY